MSKTNQCMGCQAGWPIDGKKTHREPGAGLVGCTADRYVTKPAFKCSVCNVEMRGPAGRECSLEHLPIGHAVPVGGDCQSCDTVVAADGDIMPPACNACQPDGPAYTADNLTKADIDAVYYVQPHWNDLADACWTACTGHLLVTAEDRKAARQLIANHLNEQQATGRKS